MAEKGNLRRRTCCFMGHHDLEPWEEPKVLTRLRYHMWPTIQGDVLYFGVGGAGG